MVTHIEAPMRKYPMKATVEISDSLLRQARELAAREGVTLRALVERGLRHVVADMQQGKPFTLRRASFKGKGLVAERAGAPSRSLHDLSYEGRGGSGRFPR
jgi:hypothetical protein